MPNYHQGLLYISYFLISPQTEISDDGLYHLHKMRVGEGMPDDIFAEHFKSLIGKCQKEIYQIGIESLSRCSHVLKIKALSRLVHMALSDQVINIEEVRSVFYSVDLSNDMVDSVINTIHQQNPSLVIQLSE